MGDGSPELGPEGGDIQAIFFYDGAMQAPTSAGMHPLPPMLPGYPTDNNKLITIIIYCARI